MLGRPRRVVLAGHLDTVPPFDDRTGRLEGDTLWGLGSVDMKGGLAVLLDLAAAVAAPAVDVTYVLYACEEVARRDNALARLAETNPDLLAADAAVLGEPTAGVVEAGCQGTMRAVVSVGGRRAHTARPWTGVNAVHRLAPVLAALGGYEPRRVVLDGCEYTEQLQAVGVEGGVAGNVVPDAAAVTVNYRFAPDRDVDAAARTLRDLVGGDLDTSAGDRFEIVDAAAGAPAGPRPPPSRVTGGGVRGAAAGQGGVDRRGHLRRDRRPRHQLRARGPAARPHRPTNTSRAASSRAHATSSPPCSSPTDIHSPIPAEGRSLPPSHDAESTPASESAQPQRRRRTVTTFP